MENFDYKRKSELRKFLEMIGGYVLLGITVVLLSKGALWLGTYVMDFSIQAKASIVITIMLSIGFVVGYFVGYAHTHYKRRGESKG